MRNKWVLLALIMCLIGSLVGCKNKEKVYNQALSLIEQNKYIDAVETLNSINKEKEYDDLINYLFAKESYGEWSIENYGSIEEAYKSMNKIDIENYEEDFKNDIIEFRDIIEIDMKYLQAKELYEKRIREIGDEYENIKKAYEIMDTINEDIYEGDLKDVIIEFKDMVKKEWEDSKYLDELGIKILEIIEFNNKMIDVINNNVDEILFDSITEKFGLYRLSDKNPDKYPFGETKFTDIHESIKKMKPPANKKLISLHSEIMFLTSDMVKTYNSLLQRFIDSNIDRAATGLIKDLQEIEGFSRQTIELRDEILIYVLD